MSTSHASLGLYDGRCFMSASRGRSFRDNEVIALTFGTHDKTITIYVDPMQFDALTALLGYYLVEGKDSEFPEVRIDVSKDGKLTKEAGAGTVYPKAE